MRMGNTHLTGKHENISITAMHTPYSGDYSDLLRHEPASIENDDNLSLAANIAYLIDFKHCKIVHVRTGNVLNIYNIISTCPHKIFLHV
jgi:hypothetical protein